MNFSDAEAEARIRLTEARLILNNIRLTAPVPPVPVDDLQKAQRGLWLVCLYAALERGTNAIVEAALQEVSSHATPSASFVPAMHSIIHFPRIQAVKDCGYDSVFDNCIELFGASFGVDPIALRDNPLAKYLQNADGGTIEWICKLFGCIDYTVTGAPRARLSTLRERRNAVAHGRETAVQVGERYDLDELERLYEVVDSELMRFRLHLQSYSVSKAYVRVA